MAFPQIDIPSAGPLTVADLDAARKHSAGNVWLLPRRVMQCPPCNGDCRQGRDCPGPDTVPTDYGSGWLDSCAPEGGRHADPVESMARYRQTASTVRWGVALAVVLAVVGYGFRVFWPIV